MSVNKKVTLTTKKDVKGNDFIVAKFDRYSIDGFLVAFHMEFLKDHSLIELDNFIASKYKRDGAGNYHMTVVPVYHYEKDVKKYKKLIGKEVNIELLGLGKAEKNNNEAHFIVIKSDELDQLLTKFGLEKPDYHITLAFQKKDVFGVSKGEDSIYYKF